MYRLVPLQPGEKEMQGDGGAALWWMDFKG